MIQPRVLLGTLCGLVLVAVAALLARDCKTTVGLGRSGNVGSGQAPEGEKRDSTAGSSDPTGTPSAGGSLADLPQPPRPDAVVVADPDTEEPMPPATPLRTATSQELQDFIESIRKKGSSITARDVREAQRQLRIWGSSAAQAVLAAITAEQDVAVKTAFFSIVGGVHDPSYADYLQIAIETEEAAEARRVVAAGLLYHHRMAAVSAIDRQLARETDATTRAHLLSTLGSTPGKDARETLMRHFWQIRDSGERMRIVNSLGRSKDPSILPILLEALKDADMATRWAAMQAIAVRGDKTALSAVRGVAERATDQQEREYAEHLIARLRNE